MNIVYDNGVDVSFDREGLMTIKIPSNFKRTNTSNYLGSKNDPTKLKMIEKLNSDIEYIDHTGVCASDSILESFNKDQLILVKSFIESFYLKR